MRTKCFFKLQQRAFLLFLFPFFLFGCQGGCSKTDEKEGDGEEKAKTEHKDGSGVKGAITPPLPSADPPYQEYAVNPKEDTTIRYKTGSKVHVPSGAFLDQEGEVVEEEVNLRYREMHDPIGFFAAGVPMTIQQNGQEKVFESAGMCDIRARMKGGENGKNERLQVNPEKKIEVEMASQVEGDFRVYHMDEENAEWEQTSEGAGETRPLSAEAENGDLIQNEEIPEVDVPDPGEMPEDPLSKMKLIRLGKVEMKGIDIEESSYEGQQDEEPEKVGTGSGQTLVRTKSFFVHDDGAARNSKSADQRTLQLLQRFDGDQFLPATPSSCQVPRYFAMFRARRIRGTENVYRLTFYEDEAGQASTACTFRKYSSMETLKRDLEAEWEEYRQELAEYREKRRRYEEKRQDSIQVARANERNSSAEVRRVFSVEGFGFVNCDSPEEYPDEAELVAEFEDPEGKKLQFSNLKLASMDPKMLYDHTGESRIGYDPEVENLLWGIVSGGALAYYPMERFSQLDPNNKSHTFQMKVREEVESYEELRSLLLSEES